MRRIKGRHLVLAAVVLVSVAVGCGAAWLHYDLVAVHVMSQGGRPFDPVDLAFIQCVPDAHTFPRCVVSPDNVVVITTRDPDASDLLVGLAAGAASLVIVGSAAFFVANRR